MHFWLRLLLFCTLGSPLVVAETDATVEARAIEATVNERLKFAIPAAEKNALLKDSETSLQKLVSQNDTDADVLAIYGRFCWRFGDQQRAAQLAYSAAKLDPHNPIALKLLTECYLREGRVREAIETLRRISNADPSDAQAQFDIGSLAMILHSEVPVAQRDAILAYALRAYRRAIELDPRNSLYPQAYGEAIYQMQQPDWKAAFSAWQRVRALNPDAEFANYHLVKVARLLGREEDAEIILNQVAEPLRTRIQTALAEESAPPQAEPTVVTKP